MKFQWNDLKKIKLQTRNFWYVNCYDNKTAMMFDVVDFTKRWWGKLWEWEIEDEEYYKNERNKNKKVYFSNEIKQ